MKVSILVLLCGIVAPFYAHAELQATSFPKTYADVSFVDRVAIETEAYKPFMDKSVYQSLDIVPGEEIYTDHLIAQMEDDASNICSTTGGATGICQPIETTQPDLPSTQPTTPTQFVGPSYYGPTIGGGPVIENNIVTGGACYPAARDNNFANKIYTTGRYEHISPAFEKGLMTVFRKEGRCGTIKNDPCGYTCYGIGSSSKCSGVVVKNRTEAEDVYYNRFWKKYHLERLPDVISTDIFLAGMASGPSTAIKQFSRFLGISPTTSINDDMINAVKNYTGDIHNRWLDKRDEFLQRVARERYNGSVSRGYKNAITLKRKNGCHVRPAQNEILTR